MVVKRKSDSRIDLNLELRMQFYQRGADVSIFNFEILNFCSRVNVIIPESLCNEKAHKMATNIDVGRTILENSV